MLDLNDVRRCSENEPTAQNGTTLDWTLSEPIATLSANESNSEFARITELSSKPSIAIFVASGRSSKLLRKPLVVLRNTSARNTSVPRHFPLTSEGRYIVRLSFNNGRPISLDESRSVVISRLSRMEQRLVRDPINASEHGDFLAEYENFFNMTKSLPTEIIKPDQHYIPHHAVLRDSGTTTGLRVIFNASFRTTRMLLNNHMLIGSKLQKDLCNVMIQWRKESVMYSGADIAKVYQQILVDYRDTDYQRIVWRSFPMWIHHGVPYFDSHLRRSRRCSLFRPSGIGSTHGWWISASSTSSTSSDMCWWLRFLRRRQSTRETDARLIELLKKGGFRLRKSKMSE